MKIHPDGYWRAINPPEDHPDAKAAFPEPRRVLLRQERNKPGAHLRQDNKFGLSPGQAEAMGLSQDHKAIIFHLPSTSADPRALDQESSAVDQAGRRNKRPQIIGVYRAEVTPDPAELTTKQNTSRQSVGPPQSAPARGPSHTSRQSPSLARPHIDLNFSPSHGEEDHSPGHPEPSPKRTRGEGSTTQST